MKPLADNSRLFEFLFKFPTVMADASHEEEKKRSDPMLYEGSKEIDIIIGEAEVPYYGFISIVDRWIPVEDSRTRALDGIFDACFVQFETGSYLVPWTKSKFKKEYKKFVDSLPVVPVGETVDGKVRQLTKAELQEFVNSMPPDEDTTD